MLTKPTLLNLICLVADRKSFWIEQMCGTEKGSHGECFARERAMELEDLEKTLQREMRNADEYTDVFVKRLGEVYTKEGKIPAIKLYKNTFGRTLMASKNAVDGYAAKHGWETPVERATKNAIQ